MRGWAIWAVASAGLSGCSLFLSDDPNPIDPPDDCQLATNSRVTLLEGEGAATEAWTAEPALVEVVGSGLPTGELVFLGAPLEFAGGALNDSVGVLEVRFPVDPARPPDLNTTETEMFDLVVFDVDGRCVRVPVELVFLPELEIAGTAINGAELEPLYSVARLDDVVGIGTSEIAIRATGGIEIRGLLDFSGDDGGEGGPGPGGGAGGETAAGQRDGEFAGGGTGSNEPPGSDIGSGAGHAQVGEPGESAGGPATGHVTLQRVATDIGRGGHGGGACSVAPGGHGGGALFAKSAGVIAFLEQEAMISVVGGDSAAGECLAGNGSAGAVYLGAPSITAVESMGMIDIGGSATDNDHVGASGGRLRVDSPDAAFVAPVAANRISHWLGGVLVAPEQRIIRGADGALTLELAGAESEDGGADGTVRIVHRVGGVDTELLAAGAPPPPTITVELKAGLNRLCVINFRHDEDLTASAPIDEDIELATNCIDVGYVP